MNKMSLKNSSFGSRKKRFNQELKPIQIEDLPVFLDTEEYKNILGNPKLARNLWKRAHRKYEENPSEETKKLLTMYENLYVESKTTHEKSKKSKGTNKVNLSR